MQTNESLKPTEWDGNDDAAEIRYSLTALGEAVLAEEEPRRFSRFSGFGPCAAGRPGADAPSPPRRRTHPPLPVPRA